MLVKYMQTCQKTVLVYNFCVQVKHAKQNVKHTKHAFVLPICGDLTGPNLYKNDWCFVLVCITWPRIVFRFGARSVIHYLDFPPTSSDWTSCCFKKKGKQILICIIRDPNITPIQCTSALSPLATSSLLGMRYLSRRIHIGALQIAKHPFLFRPHTMHFWCFRPFLQQVRVPSSSWLFPPDQVTLGVSLV